MRRDNSDAPPWRCVNEVDFRIYENLRCVVKGYEVYIDEDADRETDPTAIYHGVYYF